MVKETNVSAFSAYNTGAVKTPAPKKTSAANKKANSSKGNKNSNSNLANLSHNELVAEIISKKKAQLKRKLVADQTPICIKQPKLTKRKKKALAAANSSQTENDVAGIEPIAQSSSTPKKRQQSMNGAAIQVKSTATLANGNNNGTTNGTPETRRGVENHIVMVKTSPKSPRHTIQQVCVNDSVKEGEMLFCWLINPIGLSKFLSTIWEKSPILVDRKCPSYYGDLLSTAAIDKMLRDHRIEFGKNLDITSYKDGVRKTLNPEGRAMPPTVWDFYRQGCSIRVLNPQTFLPSVHSMNATLQEYFQCMTGANVYLTPANSQGFAPHFDDIEAFVLQIEGKKHWKVYKPRLPAEYLPRVSSGNFSQDEIGQPILDIVLEAGDMLYFPRGYIHQATTVPGHHSLHITLSVYQKHSYGDLLEVLMPMAVQAAIDENVTLREGLPLDLWQVMGLVNSDKESPQRTVIIEKIRKCFDAICEAAPIDDAVDQMAKRYQHDALPPYLTAAERARTVYGTGVIVGADGSADNPMLEMNTLVRLLRANVCRMMRHGDDFRIYFHTDNSKEYHEHEEKCVAIEPCDAPAIEMLINAYPDFLTPADLMLDDNERSLAVAQDLWERGLLMTADVLQ